MAGFDGRPSPEVSNYLRNKGWRPSFDWRDTWGTEHAHAFTVAKAMQMDVLSSIRGAVQDAIDQGQTFEAFEKGLTPKLQDLGWWGRRDMVDPKTGRVVRAQLGSPRRLRIIYNANIRTARAAGQWERAWRTRAALPYLLYELGPSERHRPEHVSWAGTVLPIEDPWWQTHMTPNGWECKCRVRQLSRTEAQRRGISGRPAGDMVKWHNKRTGQTEMVPRGIDPGWATNPGLARSRGLTDHLAGKLDAADPAIAAAAARDLVTSWRATALMAGDLPGEVPIAVMPPALEEPLGTAVRVIRLSDYTTAKARRKHPDVGVDDWLMVQALIDRGEVLRDGGHHLVLQGRDEHGRLWRAIVKATQAGDRLYLATLHRITDAQRAKALAQYELVREGE